MTGEKNTQTATLSSRREQSRSGSPCARFFGSQPCSFGYYELWGVHDLTDVSLPVLRVPLGLLGPSPHLTMVSKCLLALTEEQNVLLREPCCSMFCASVFSRPCSPFSVGLAFTIGRGGLFFPAV